MITAGTNISISSVTANGFTLSSSGATCTTSDSAPSTPTQGDLWWKSDEGRLKVYYGDGDSNQWVDASPIETSTNITQTTTNGNNAFSSSLEIYTSRSSHTIC